jgi:hypothetical protein
VAVIIAGTSLAAVVWTFVSGGRRGSAEALGSKVVRASSAVDLMRQDPTGRSYRPEVAGILIAA